MRHDIKPLGLAVRDDSNDVKLPTRVPPMSLEDFVRAHQDDFTKADAHKP